MTSFAEMMGGIHDEYTPIIRELLTYDALCPNSCKFVRQGNIGQLFMERPPSPLHWSRQIEWPWVVVNADLHNNGESVLDVGGGWGVVKYSLANRCRPGMYVSLDNDQESLRKAAISIEAIGANNIVQVCGDARRLPFPDNFFSRVVCISVLEHIKDDREKALFECIRVLRPGGLFLFTMDVLLEGGLEEDFYVTPEEMRQLFLKLGINKIHFPDSGAWGGAVANSRALIGVVMVRFEKL